MSEVKYYLEILPQELVYIIFDYLVTSENRKKLSGISGIIWDLNMKYSKDIRKGIVNPFAGFDINTKFHRICDDIYCIPDQFGVQLKNLLKLKNLKELLVNLDKVQIIYFIYINCDAYSNHSAAFIFKDRTLYQCRILTRYKIIRQYEGETWYKMWNKLTKDDKNIIAKYKYSTDFRIEDVEYNKKFTK